MGNGQPAGQKVEQSRVGATVDGRPSGRLDPTTSWNGSLLTVFGGRTTGGYFNDAYTYEVARACDRGRVTRADAAACSKIRQLSTAELMAETMRRISNEDSVSSLFME